MKKLFLVGLMLLGACANDPTSPVTPLPDTLVSSQVVTCTNGQTAPVATIQKGNRSYITLNFCVSKTITGFEGTVTTSNLQTERFVFDDPNAVWSMSRAESISQCMTTNQADPLCYYPYI